MSAIDPWPGPQPCDCGEDYPMYGVAPHDCYWRKGPEFTIGQSTILPQSEWSDLFVPDLEDGETWSDFQYPSACGVFYCPKCQSDRYHKAWAALVARIGQPPSPSTPPETPDAHDQGSAIAVPAPGPSSLRDRATSCLAAPRINPLSEGTEQ